jgi:hypothetical protein
MIYVIILVVVILLCIVIYHEQNHMMYYMKCCLSSSENRTGLPTPSHCINTIVSLITTLPPHSYTFIDFGCGDGDVISHIHSHVFNVVGVEMDDKQAERTRTRFANVSNVHINTMDMLDYEFQDTPTILYMYEPLWCLDKQEAISIYSRVVEHFYTLSSPCYILYISGAFPILDESFFEKCTTLHHSRIPRFLGWNGNHMYLFQKK